jgi:hypothetical protein
MAAKSAAVNKREGADGAGKESDGTEVNVAIAETPRPILFGASIAAGFAALRSVRSTIVVELTIGWMSSGGGQERRRLRSMK